MDPNLNRNSMGSRAGTSLKNKLGAGPPGAPSRIGTIGKGLNPLGGVGSTVEVKDRPLTTGGGINGPQGGDTKRKVYDRNYYVTKTKEKLMSIQEETDKLKAKTQQIGKEQQLYNKLEARLEELTTEVRNLEGQLADYNLSLDKLRINTRPEDIKNAYNHVKNNNQKLKSQLDDIFLERKKIEEETESIRNELSGIQKQMELRLNQLDPSQRTEYQRLMAENNDLLSEYNQKQAAMEELLNKLANADNKLRMDSQKLKGRMLKKEIVELQSKKSDYEIQLNEANLSIPEARERILNRMKQDNAAIVNMEKKTKDIKKNIDVYEKRLRELEANLQDKKTEEEDKKKYQILYQKDKEMDQFLNSFDRIRSNELNDLTKIQKLISETLEQTSKVLQISNQMPTQNNANVNRDRSQNTIAQTKAQYQIRLNNLRALQNTEKRTAEEIGNLKSNIEKMKEEIVQKFDKVEQIKDKLNKNKQKLIDDEKALNLLKDKIGPTINGSDYELNIAQKKYQMHDGYAGYNGQERKLSDLQNKRYYLKYYINTKSKDINYEDIKNQCMSYAEELNKKIVSHK